jgi:hypothetical protein
MRKRTVLWVLLAVLGLVVAAGVTAAASRLSSQHVGLSSEPLSAGQRLAPEARAVRSAPRHAKQRPARRPATSPAPASEGSDDHGGHGDD